LRSEKSLLMQAFLCAAAATGAQSGDKPEHSEEVLDYFNWGACGAAGRGAGRFHPVADLGVQHGQGRLEMYR
jgi:hypothetical protein